MTFLNLNSDNHGQKSWDKFTFVALFHMRQTNSHAQIHPNLFSPSPLQCWTCVHAISPEFQHCIGGAHILKRITVLFENSVLKTQKIYAFTQVSKGLLSRIVGLLIVFARVGYQRESADMLITFIYFHHKIQ